jgi:hypothetical protein
MGLNMTPYRLMIHSFDFYPVTFTLSGGGQVASYPTVPTYAHVQCAWQDPTTEVFTEYKQRDERVSAVVFTLEKTIWELIKVKDRLTYKGLNYRVVGKKNLSGLDRVFQIDVQSEVL